MVVRIFILALLTACASSRPTPYQKEKKKQGYRDQSLEDLRVASFRGNAYTKKDRASLFAEFRAIENCQEGERKHANIIDISDKTVAKEITRSSGGVWGPSFYGGMYPYYSRHSSFGVGIDYSSVNTQSWNETLLFPYIEIYYTCSDKIYRPQVHFKELSAEQVKHLIKDVKGGLQVEKILDSSPNKETVQVGDIILKANGRRVEKIFELIRLFNENHDVVTLQILREGHRVNSKLLSVEVTSEVAKAERSIIQKVCSYKTDKYQKALKERPICLRKVPSGK